MVATIIGYALFLLIGSMVIIYNNEKDKMQMPAAIFLGSMTIAGAILIK